MSDMLLLPREARRDIAAGLDAPQARWLVDYYYAVQDYRIQAAGQARAVAQDADQGTVELAAHVAGNMETIESEIQKALGEYAMTHVPGQWALAQHGIGPVLSAGLLAHIDIEKAPTVGHIWRFAGLDPSVKWFSRAAVDTIVKDVHPGKGNVTEGEFALIAERFSNLTADKIVSRLANHPKGPKSPTVKNVQAACALRPWNASLKVLCWKIGDSFVKQSGSDKCVYGHIYRARKEQEVAFNNEGRFADQAAKSLVERNIKDKDLRVCYEAGRLPDGRIDLRARRYAVKLFLSHLHFVMFEDRFGEPPPKPYVLTVEGGHAHFIAPPHWPL